MSQPGVALARPSPKTWGYAAAVGGLPRGWRLPGALCVLLWLVGCAAVSGKRASSPESEARKAQAAPAQARPVELLSTGQLPLGPVGLDQLGTVIGAAYEEALGRLFVIGNGLDLGASPSEAQLALALGRVAGQRMRPSISIDPRAGDLEGPVHDVTMTEEVVQTDFGWAMVEADRRLKGYSLGRDNITGQALAFSAPGFANRFQDGEQADQRSQGVQRFWLEPSQDDLAYAGPSALRIEQAGITVRAEGMRELGGRLVVAPERVSPAAQHFAAYATRHFQELAREEPSFRRADQLVRLMILAEWARQRRVPVSLDRIFEHSRQRFVVPEQTPSLSVDALRTVTTRQTQSDRTVTTRSERRLRASGGFTFQVLEVHLREAAGEGLMTVPKAVAGDTEPEQASRFEQGGHIYVAYAVPAGRTRKRRLEPLATVALKRSKYVL